MAVTPAVASSTAVPVALATANSTIELYMDAIQQFGKVFNSLTKILANGNNFLIKK